MKQLLFFLTFMIITLGLSAQHQLGWRTDNYAGINAAMNNPAATGRTPYSWDLNLAEANIFFSNNYGFFENASVSSLLKAFREAKTAYTFRSDLPADATIGDETLVYDFSSNNSYFAQQHISVLGPSFSVRVAPMTRIGIFSRWQAMTSLKDLDQDIGYYSWNSISEATQFTLDATRISSAAWSEIGLNISQGFSMNTAELYVGLNARKLSGHRAAYFTNNKDFTVSKLPSYVGLEGQQFDIETGFTNNLISEDNFNDSPGSGWGFDVGFLYQIDLGDDFFRWEVGAAILDVGKINFTDAQTHRFTSDVLASTINDNYNNIDDTEALETITQIFSQDILGDSLLSLQSNDLTINLPTTLSFQLAYRFSEFIKIEGNVFTGLTSKGASLARSTTIGVTPRMDRYWWSVAMPISYYAGEELRLGLSARLGPVFIGTDELGSFFKQKEFDSTDFYVGVKFFPPAFGNRDKKGQKSGKNKRRGGKDVECYKF